jgi:hypothetical protein
MKESTSLNEYYSKEIEEELTTELNKRGTKDFSEAKKWHKKEYKKGADAEKILIRRLVEILSQYLSKGLLQLTIEELAHEKEYKDAVKEKKDHALVINHEKKLPPFKAYVEFVVKLGWMELKKIRYDFKVEPKVKVKNARIEIRENKIASITFGSLVTSITLYLLKGDLSMKILSKEISMKIPRPITVTGNPKMN